MFFHLSERPISHPYKTVGKIRVIYIYIYTYVYIYMYISINIHTYIYTYTFLLFWVADGQKTILKTMLAIIS
jgi:hypothetical protein